MAFVDQFHIIIVRRDYRKAGRTQPAGALNRIAKFAVTVTVTRDYGVSRGDSGNTTIMRGVIIDVPAQVAKYSTRVRLLDLLQTPSYFVGDTSVLESVA